MKTGNKSADKWVSFYIKRNVNILTVCRFLLTDIKTGQFSQKMFGQLGEDRCGETSGNKGLLGL